MANTKIINVLKDDKFEDILDLFNQASAPEVILILPKKCKAFSNEEHFATLQSIADENGKTVSLLCSNPDINDLARKYNFDVLLSEKTDKNPTLIRAVNQVVDQESVTDDTDDAEDDTEIEDIKDDDEVLGSTADLPDSDDDKYEIVTAAVRKNLDDIVRQSDDDIKNLRINQSGREAFKVQVRKSKTDGNFDKIKEVWDESRSWDRTERPERSFNFIKFFKNHRTAKLTAYMIIGLIIIALGLFAMKGNAFITIQPYSTIINPQIKISASDKYSAMDFNQNRIPGQLINTDKSVTKTFNATGEKDVAQKARGKIEVFNNLSVAQPLVATTRFQNDAGLIYRTLKSINVPSGKSVIVEVIADKTGSDYNIGPTDFIVSSFKESGDKDKLSKVYGKSSENMRGGTSGKAKVVTESDYNQAKESLMIDLKNEIENGLKSQSANLKIVTTTVINTKDPVSSARIDEAADNFTMTLSGSVRTIAFKEEGLNDLIKQSIEKKGSVIIFPEKLEKSYAEVRFDEASSILNFTVTVRGSSYAKVNTDQITDDIVGKSIIDTKTYLERLTINKIIRGANVKLSFLWMQKLPTDKARIKIDLSY